MLKENAQRFCERLGLEFAEELVPYYEKGEKLYAEIEKKEAIIDFTNKSLTKYLIKLSPLVDQHDEKKIGAYFHVLNDLERVGDHAENFGEIGVQMQAADLSFSEGAVEELKLMEEKVLKMFSIAIDAISNGDAGHLNELTALENDVDGLKKELSSRHFYFRSQGMQRPGHRIVLKAGYHHPVPRLHQ